MARFIFFILVFISFSACNKSEICFANICDWEDHNALAVLNGTEVWSGEACNFGVHKGKWNVVLNSLNKNNIRRESLVFSNIEREIGKHILKPNWPFVYDRKIKQAVLYTFVSEGDGVTEKYILYNQKEFENYVEITDVSEDGKVLEGKYQLYLVLDPDGPSKFNHHIPDTVIFTHGAFKAMDIF